MKLRDPSYRQGKYDRNGPDNVTGNKMIDAGIHILGGRMFTNAWNNKHTHSRGILFMNSIMLVDGFTSPRSSFKFRNRPRVIYENFGGNTTYLSVGDTQIRKTQRKKDVLQV